MATAPPSGMRSLSPFPILSEENEEEEASEDSESGVASLALATAFVSKSRFNSEENDVTNKADEGNDDYAPTYCFMAKGARVLKYTSSESISLPTNARAFLDELFL